MTETQEKPSLNNWKMSARDKEYEGLSDIFDNRIKHDSGADQPDECYGCRIGGAIDDWYYSDEFPVYTCKLT
jgi:hypothetical protein